VITIIFHLQLLQLLSDYGRKNSKSFKSRLPVYHNHLSSGHQLVISVYRYTYACALPWSIMHAHRTPPPPSPKTTRSHKYNSNNNMSCRKIMTIGRPKTLYGRRIIMTSRNRKTYLTLLRLSDDDDD